MNAALGPPSEGGIGTPESEVTQSGGGPNAFVAIQPGGNVGGAWPSKLSLTTIGFQQPKGPHEGVGTGPSPSQPISPGEFGSPVRGGIAFEDVITAAASVTAAAAQTASVVVRLTKPFVSVCRCSVENKER
jgi:hypothetical protein